MVFTVDAVASLYLFQPAGVPPMTTPGNEPGRSSVHLYPFVHRLDAVMNILV